MHVPWYLWARAWVQWVFLAACYALASLFGLLLAAVAALTSKHGPNSFGEVQQRHRQKYIDSGSSGLWAYYASRMPFIKWWSNYEDGDLGESSGKWSASCKGKERSLWNRYRWLALRNPFNRGKRTIPFFHCLVGDCTLAHYGDYTVSDKTGVSGKQFVIATHKTTGKKYYGYYSVKVLSGNRVRVWRLGFKIKPAHATHSQDADDKDKTFTFRYQHASEIN